MPYLRCSPAVLSTGFPLPPILQRSSSASDESVLDGPSPGCELGLARKEEMRLRRVGKGVAWKSKGPLRSEGG